MQGVGILAWCFRNHYQQPVICGSPSSKSRFQSKDADSGIRLLFILSAVDAGIYSEPEKIEAAWG